MTIVKNVLNRAFNFKLLLLLLLYNRRISNEIAFLLRHYKYQIFLPAQSKEKIDFFSCLQVIIIIVIIIIILHYSDYLGP